MTDGPGPDTSDPIQVIVGTPVWSLNGVNAFSANLVAGLTELGVEAQILVTRPDRADDKPLDPPTGLELEYFPVDPDAPRDSRLEALAQYLTARAPCAYIPNHDYEHTAVAARLPDDVVVIGVVHSDDPEHYEHARAMGPYWHAVVAVSRHIAVRLRDTQPELAARVEVIPYGVDIPGSPPTPAGGRGEPLSMVYSGRLVEYQKRILDLPPLLERLHRRGIDVRLEVVGGGTDADLIRQLCAPAVARGMVRFRGILGGEELHEIYDRSAAFLLTSAFEGLPRALLEAMGRACVPVVSDIASGIPELVRDGHNGFRVPVGDLAAFEDRIAALAGDPVLRDRMARRAYDTVADGPYHVEDMAARYLQVIRQALADTTADAFHRPDEPVAWSGPEQRIRPMAEVTARVLAARIRAVVDRVRSVQVP